MDKFLSIIIPVYNTYTTIRECIVSCTLQDIDENEYEIIVINDGSTDRSIDIIKEFAQIFNNIIIIDKENGGVSSARNAGLRIAKGRYIWFVDSDDWIEINCLKTILIALNKDDLDVMQIGYNRVQKNKIIPLSKKFRINTEIYNSKEYVDEGFFIGAACGTIFKRKIIIDNNILFDEELELAEDQIFLLSILNYCQCVKRVNLFCYYYRSNPNSATNNTSHQKLIISIEKICNFRFFKTYEKYCKYLITIQFFIYLNLKYSDTILLHKHVKNQIIDYKSHPYYLSLDKIVFLYIYSKFGKFSLPILYLFIRIRRSIILLFD